MMRSGRYPYAFRRSIPQVLSPAIYIDKFDATTAYDVSDGGRNLAEGGTGSPIILKAFQNEAYTNTGGASYFYTSSDPLASVQSSGACSFSVWAKTGYTGTYGASIYYGNNFAKRTWYLGADSSKWKFQTLLNDSTVELALDSTITPSASRWDHLCGTYNNGSMKLYVNGKLMASGSFSASNGTSTVSTEVYVGFNMGTTQQWCSAPMAFTRELTSNEVQAIYYSTYRN
jgi:hypothetical protein